SAPKYAGQYKVNPIAMLLTSKLMLDWLKEKDMASRLENAIARVIKEGKVRTYDMGGNACPLDVPKAIANYAVYLGKVRLHNRSVRRGDTGSPWRGREFVQA